MREVPKSLAARLKDSQSSLAEIREIVQIATISSDLHSTGIYGTKTPLEFARRQNLRENMANIVAEQDLEKKILRKRKDLRHAEEQLHDMLHSSRGERNLPALLSQ
ncbi:uncharacterized [Tachysurus ichikawai]